MTRCITICCFLWLLSSCKNQSNEASEGLAKVIETYQNHSGYDKKEFPLGLHTAAYYKSEAQFAKLQLDALAAISTSGLTHSEQISHELLSFVLQDKIDYYTYEQYLNPLLSDSGFHLDLNYKVKPLENYQDVNAYLNTLNAIPEFVSVHIKNLRDGLKKGRSQPRVIFKGYASTYDNHLVNQYEESFFYGPFKKLPSQLTATQKDSILQAAKQAIEINVIPEFRKIKTFFETEYLPQTRTSIGVFQTPNGEEFYQNRINFYTTSTKYTANDIHQIGLKEVARIKSEMENLINEVNFEGSFSEFLAFLRTDPQFYASSARELLMIARDISKRIDAELPRFFKTLPRKPYGVAAVPDAIAPKYTGGRYIPTTKNSSKPGFFWVNTYNLNSRTLYTLPSLAAHEGVPGHHLQGALNNELEEHIPQFRKDLYLSAYGEGWGLYSESLASEMGIYTTPYEEFGKLTYEMWRACRLVVDTGIHAKGWTREQVVKYMTDNSALSLHEINTETDRYISWPGQALSYKIGELKIQELLQRTKKSLGAHFDYKEFHEIILGQGTVSLDILEQRIDGYILSKTELE
jgi:uncharacterized protein (DUF885 family)